MIELVKRFFYDETAARRFLRASLAAIPIALQAAVQSGYLSSESQVVRWAQVLTVFAFAIGAGDKNPEKPE